ncbi:SUKH-4 family immunity protein [Streptomyces sp. NPDC059477]|uniref:SUKH-4 family immunity protein n=1 Tax=Streptomyces sp. NPDC059477 TaxID=3346847 RepID=UPI0036B0B91D
MVTFAQAQERAEEWVNGELPSYQHREVRVREFDLGFVVWAEDRPDGPRSDGGAQRLVIARDSGEATLWPSLPVGEVIRRYEEEYGGVADAVPAAARGAVRVDLNQTSFLLTPPEWLQEAADKLGIADRRAGGGGAADSSAGGGAGVSGSGSGGAGGSSGGGSLGGALAPTQAGVPAGSGVPGAPAGATPWAGTDTNADGGEDRSVPLPVTVFAPPLSGADDEDTPPSVAPEAATALMSGGSGLPPTVSAPALDDSDGAGVRGTGGVPGVPGGPGARGGAVGAHGSYGGSAVPPGVVPPGAVPPGAVPSGAVPPGGTPPPAPTYGYPQGPPGPRGPGVPGTPASGTPAPGTPAPPGGASYGRPPGAPPGPPAGSHAGDIADAATSKAGPPPRRGGRGLTPPPPPPPPPGVPGVPGGSSGGYVPTQMVPSHGAGVPGVPSGAGAWPPPSVPPGGPGAPGGPGVPGAPGAPGASRGAVHYEETVLSGPPVRGPGVPPPPQAPGAPQAVAPAPGRQAPMPMQLPGQPPAYGYPPQGQPTVGPGYQAVLRYRAQDGSEQQVIRRSAPGTPHPEWQIFHELRAMNVPQDQVLELHTELESCELPGAYCARMIREQWPQARITSIASYGTDHPSRQQGMRQLLAHQGELHQVADGPARPGPVRAPLPPVQPAPPVPPEAVAQELAGAFGPGVFRFEQAAVSRQGVPPVVAHTLVVAGLPVDMGPFFWAQAQPGRPVPTLAELAQERGVRPAADAGSYLVMGSDFGKAICVQYGTANIVAVPVEPGPGGAPVPPQFVNTGLPEFVRCLALLGRMWRLRFGLNQEQAGRWTVDFQAQLAALDPAALGSPESWWSVLLEQMWDGLL